MCYPILKRILSSILSSTVVTTQSQMDGGDTASTTLPSSCLLVIFLGGGGSACRLLPPGFHIHGPNSTCTFSFPPICTPAPQTQLSPQHPVQYIYFLNFVIASLTKTQPHHLYQQKQCDFVRSAPWTLIAAARSSVKLSASDKRSTRTVVRQFSPILMQWGFGMKNEDVSWDI